MTPILSVACVLALGACLGCTGGTSPIVSTPPKITWVQVWSDEFDGPAGASIDSTKWGYEMADWCQQGICGWGNNEKED